MKALTLDRVVPDHLSQCFFQQIKLRKLSIYRVGGYSGY